jgi:hexosaminidase
MGNEKKVEYMIFPRMAALSEILWSSKEIRDWKSFEKRLPEQLKRYEMWGANYSKAYFDLKTTVLPTENYNGVIWKIQSKYARDICEYCHIQTSVEFVYQNDKIEYDTLDVVDPLDPSKIIGSKYVEHYKKAGDKGIRIGNMPWVNDTLVLLNVSETSTVKALQRFHHGKGKEITQKFHFNKATGKKISLATEATNNYPGDGAFTLVNGVINEKGFTRTKEFLGFSGTDCEAIIDLGSTQEISSVVVNTFSRTSSWIWQPQTAEAFGSTDGKNWKSLKISDDFVASTSGNGKGTMIMEFDKIKVQFVKVLLKNWGTIPEGNPGAGKKAWLFVDEIGID